MKDNKGKGLFPSDARICTEGEFREMQEKTPKLNEGKLKDMNKN